MGRMWERGREREIDREREREREGEKERGNYFVVHGWNNTYLETSPAQKCQKNSKKRKCYF